MSHSSLQKFKSYNTHNRTCIKVNDAVKITSIPQYESFWIEVKSVNNQTKEITGSVENILQLEHSFNHTDIISFYKKNIKEHKKEKDRFDLSKISTEDMSKILTSRLLNLSLEEFERCLNIRNIPRDR